MLSRVATHFARSMATKAGVVAPLSNRVFLFNCFEKPPMNDNDFFDFWVSTAYFVQKQDHFLSTHLHQCLGPESRFQWINFAVCDSNDICIFGKPNPEWAEKMKNMRTDLTLFPGEFNEIASYNGEELTDAPKERPDQSRFLITAVTAKDSVSSNELESNWSCLMKTDFIHDQLKGNPNLKDSLMYRMVSSRNPVIRYTVRTELSSMDDKDGVELAKMVDAQQNANDVETFTGFFKVHTDMFYKKE